MFKKIIDEVISTIKEEYKFIILLLCTYLVLTCPINYFIIVGGGISDIDSRIEIVDGYDSKGSFNISYVTELPGTVGSYLISFIIPDWKRVDADLYKYDEKESLDDIEFRSDLDLKVANGTAIKWAYTLANRECIEKSSKLYVIAKLDNYKNELKVQDEILSINDKSFPTLNEYKAYLQTLNSGDKVDVLVLRDGKKKNITAPLYEEDGRIILGVGLQILKEYDTDPDVKINFKKTESGPSGGLITTLDIYNKLTKKDLTNSLKIAGTGTINEDGTIGSIGEVKYKLLGAVSDDADVFLVPSGENYKTCMKVKKEKKLDIKILEIKNIKDAIEKLEKLK